MIRSLDKLDFFRPLWESKTFSDIFDGKDFPVDIKQDGDIITVKAELPGVEKDDISIDYNNTTLTIRAEKKEEVDESTANYIRKESSYGSISRSFTVGDIDPEDIKATFNNGVLSIVLKNKECSFTKIEIK